MFKLSHRQTAVIHYNVQSRLSYLSVCHFAKRARNRKTDEIKERLPGLRKSLMPEKSNNSFGSSSVYVGPSWIVAPPHIHTPAPNVSVGFNWVKNMLEQKIISAFPQTTSMAHRGKKFFNKIHYSSIMNYDGERIKNYLLDNEIRRVILFTDEWPSTIPKWVSSLDIFIDNEGYLKQSSNKNKSELAKFNVESPLIYFIRDLISNSVELDDKVKIYIFQNMMHYNNFLTQSQTNWKINHELIRSHLVDLLKKQQQIKQKELFEKLWVTSLSASLINAKDVHIVYYPLVHDLENVSEDSKNF